MILRWVFRNATRRASRGGHWGWWLVVASVWLLQRDRDASSQAVISMPIKQGQQILVSMADDEVAP
jgi:hypothetical protein